MIEKTYGFTFSEKKLIEKILEDDHAAINHIVLEKGDILPEHFSNSNVYLIIIRGNIMLDLGDSGSKLYAAGNIITIPYNTKMRISNSGEDLLEFFVVKAPGPKTYGCK